MPLRRWCVVLLAFAAACVQASTDAPAPQRQATAPQPEVTGPQPFELTASDGTGLTLVALRARAVVEAPLAITELHLTFENPAPRVIEGRFRITLPPGAALSRFAMRLGDQWQEGEVVERRTAQRIYEDFLHRKQDPALLEQQAGNEFAARVFPIPANGRKELIVSYSETLVGADARFRLILRGLPLIRSFEARVLARARPSAPLTPMRTVRHSEWKPDTDVELPLAETFRPIAVRSGPFAIARISPAIDDAPTPVESLLLLVDTSASRALGLTRQIEIVEQLVQTLRARGLRELTVAAFDQEVEELFRGNSDGFGKDALARLRERRALGATDLARILAWAKEHPAPRIVLVSDGVATAGDHSGESLRTAVQALAKEGAVRLDAITLGGIRDEAALTTIVGGNGVVIDGTQPMTAIARRLTHAVRSGLEVSVPHARWVHPTRLDGMQPGDETLVYAELPENEPLVMQVDGREVLASQQVLNQAQPQLVARASAAARIAALSAQADALSADAQAQRDELRSEIIATSVSNRVVSPLTAFLVLESQSDYERYGLDRRALADIVTVGKEGLVVVSRSKPDAPAKRAGASGNEDTWAADMPRGKDDALVEGTSEAIANPSTPPPREERSAGTPAPPAAQRVAGEVSERSSLERMLRFVTVRKPSVDQREEDRAKVMRSGLIALPGGDSAGDGRPGAHGGGLGAGLNQALGGGDAQGIGGLGARGAGAGGGGVASERLFVGSGSAHVEAPPQDFEPQNVQLAVIDLDGGLRRRALEQALARHRRTLLECIDATNDRREVDTEVRLGISTSGKVTRAGLALPGRAALAACLAEKLKTLEIQPPPSDATSALVRLRIDAALWSGLAQRSVEPLTGKLADVMAAIASGHADQALRTAHAWQSEQPGDVLALVALGEAAEASGDRSLAARAYGSVIDLFPMRADLRRFAAGRLERVPDGMSLALDSLRTAAAQRPDHASSHHLLGLALLRAGQPEKAFEAFAGGLGREYPNGRFSEAKTVLAEDLGLAAAAWTKAQPSRAKEIRQRLRDAGGSTESAPSVRFLLTWETDANDVDFHVHDAKGGHAYYAQMQLPSGGRLYADVTTGYGPECFTIRTPPGRRAGPYWLEAHYYARGPMGYGMGQLDVVEHDGRGRVRVETRPFVVMQDHAYVELGKVGEGRLAKSASLR